jgi:DNA-directed RNA polymerase subunit H (RpoH/RPB5)
MKNLNVIEHEMVPEHFIMSDEEVHECKEIAAKKDDVIRIKRRSLTADEAVSYRLVIDTKMG